MISSLKFILVISSEVRLLLQRPIILVFSSVQPSLNRIIAILQGYLTTCIILNDGIRVVKTVVNELLHTRAMKEIRLKKITRLENMLANFCN